MPINGHDIRRRLAQLRDFWRLAASAQHARPCQRSPGTAGRLFLINIWKQATKADFSARLERRHSFFVAAAVTSLPLTAVHMPLQVI
jgi:hypothetical protein